MGVEAGRIGLFLVPILLLMTGACSRGPSVHSSLSVDRLDTIQPEIAARHSVASLNLVCAQGLPGSWVIDLATTEGTLHSCAERVRTETERHRYRFQRNPAEYENSEGYFRMLMLTVVLAEDFSVHYQEERRIAPGSGGANDGFFSDASAVFLPGLLGPKREGTCSSMPVLYVAIGRKLAYPLKLVTTKGHLFVRWEGKGERFNIEATVRGLAKYDDDHYRHWPFEITAQEEAAEGYLKSLTPAEELAAFLSIRAMCQREAGQVDDAAQSFAAAARLAPGCASYRMMAGRLASEEAARNGTRTKLQQDTL